MVRQDEQRLQKTLRPIILTEEEFEQLCLIFRKNKLLKFNQEPNEEETDEGYIFFSTI
jgi:hypothetical protein